MQVPRPSQVLAGVSTPPAHTAAWQGLPAGYFAQPPSPLQVPFCPQLSTGSTRQRSGSAAPAPSGLHSPGFAGWLQRTHAPVQARLQHTPSAQKPETHSAAEEHAPPSGFLPQLSFMHVRPAQSSSRLQLLRQVLVAASQA
jgi:hypothetical protein